MNNIYVVRYGSLHLTSRKLALTLSINMVLTLIWGSSNIFMVGKGVKGEKVVVGSEMDINGRGWGW